MNDHPSQRYIVIGSWLALLAVAVAAVVCLSIAISRKSEDKTPRAIGTSAEHLFQQFRARKDADRQKVAEMLVNDRHLIGLTEQTLHSSLGEPDVVGYFGRTAQSYDIGDFIIDDVWLHVNVKGGVVVDAKLGSD